jgi:hypothetical protein
LRVIATLWALLALPALVASCMSTETAEEETPVEDSQRIPELEEVTQKDITQAPPRSEEEAAADEAKRKAAEQGKGGAQNIISIDPNSPVPPAEQVEHFRMLCQVYKASGENIEAFEGTFEAYFQEGMNTGRTIAELLSERGYECTNEEVRNFQRLE